MRFLVLLDVVGKLQGGGVLAPGLRRLGAARRQQDQQANQNEGIKVQTERIMHVV